MRRWCGIDVGGVHQIAQIKMGVTARTGMYIDVDEFGTRRRVRDIKASFFAGLAECTVPRQLSRFDVTTRLQPFVQSLVEVQNNAALSDHDRRTGDMDRVGCFAERMLECVEPFNELDTRTHLAFVDANSTDYFVTDNRARINI